MVVGAWSNLHKYVMLYDTCNYRVPRDIYFQWFLQIFVRLIKIGRGGHRIYNFVIMHFLIQVNRLHCETGVE